MLLVEGPAGIGKTTLLAGARQRASANGMTVLHTRGTPLERDYAMGLVRQALEPVVRRARDTELFAGAAGLAGNALLDLPGGAAAPPAGVLHGLYWLIANLAERAPVLLAVDDAHWGDEPSLRFLAFLARRVESIAVALVIADRAGLDEGTAAEILREIRSEPAADLVRLEPLGVTGVEAVLREVGAGIVDEEFALACHDATGGNPFLLSELVRSLRAEGVSFTAASAARLGGFAPPTVSRRLRSTLDGIGPAARSLARAVAVLGEDVELELAAKLGAVSMAEAPAVAGELTRAGVLADSTPLGFLHPLLAGAARADLSAQERAAMHARAAELLRARGAAAERVALQLMHASPAGEEWVVAELREAAERARMRGAPATAAGLLRRALAEPPTAEARAGLLLELGEAEYAVGQTVEAAIHLEEAQRCAVGPAIRGRALIGLFQARAGNFTDQRAMDSLIERALPEVLDHDRELGLRLWTLRLLAIEPGPRWGEAARGVELLVGNTPGEAILRGHWALPIVSRGTSAEVLRPVAVSAAPHADLLFEEGATALVMTGVILGLLWTDELALAEDILGRGIAVAARRGAIGDFALAHQFRAMVRRRAGRLREAEADAQSALSAAGGAGWGGAGRAAATMLLGSLLDQGRVDEAAAAAAGLDEIPDSPALNQLLVERMRLFAALGDHRRAQADWTEARRRAERHFTGIDPSWVPAVLAAADSCHALGKHDVRDALLDEATELAERWGTPGFIGQARHRAARLRGGDDAVERIREAVDRLRQSPARLELARALVSLGEVLRRCGGRVSSREPLREGYELARQCGASALAETARSELRASGVRLRRDALSGADSLTASERRIAELAAGGASNAEIAQALFLTVKTVEMHLTHAYRKLDIAGRAGLRSALAGKP